MSIVPIQSTDIVKNSREVINNNFSYLDTAKTEQSAFNALEAVVNTKADDSAVVKLTGNQTVAGVKTFSSSPIVPAPTTDLHASTKKYVDDIAIAGAPDASTTVKGLVEEATQAEVEAFTATGGTGARLFLNPSLLKAALGAVVSVEQTTGATHSLTTVAGERVVVWAKGDVASYTFSDTPTVTLKYGGVTKDTVETSRIPAINTKTTAFALMYTEVPGAATADITVELSGGGTLEYVSIIVLKLKL